LPVIPTAVQTALGEMFRGAMTAEQASASIQARVVEFVAAQS